MTNLDNYTTFLMNLFNAGKIPICLFQDGKKVAQVPAAIPYFLEVVQPYYESLLNRDADITYLTTQNEAAFGMIRQRSENLVFFFGPFFLVSLDKEAIRNLIQRLNIPKEHLDSARIYLGNIETGALHQFLSGIACLHFAVNHEVVNIESIDYDPSFRRLQDDMVRHKFVDNRYNDYKESTIHTTYLSELQHMDLISTGNVHRLEQLSLPVSGKQGKTAKNSLRQAKNNFIASATLYCRAAIVGGMDLEDAFNLSDAFVLQSEECTSLVELERLLRHMPIAFAERVERDVKFSSVSQPIMKAIHYIRKNIHQPLNADILAEHVNLSTSYFLKRFKEETGIGISDFIISCKIEEACLLLTYTDRSLSDISAHLCFSSQSYFQNVFKKYTGVTPGQFRNRQKLPVICQVLKDHGDDLRI